MSADYRDFDWDGVLTALERHDPDGWFTTANYPLYFDLYEEVAAVDRHFRDIVRLRDKKLESRLWGKLRDRQKRRVIERLRDHLTDLCDGIRAAVRILSNFVLNGYNSVKTYAGKPNTAITLSKLNSTVSQHPENRQEFCKTRLEYIQWVLTETYSTQLIEEYCDPYLDGEGVNFDDFIEWLVQYERQVEVFLLWMHGFQADVVEELSVGLDDTAEAVRDRLLTYRYNGDRPNWADVESLCESVMDDPDPDAFVDHLERVHEHGSRQREYVGLRVWLANRDEIEQWERTFDDGYEYDYGDPSCPDPELRVEAILARDRDRWDTVTDDWAQVREWAAGIQFAPADPGDTSDPAPNDTRAGAQDVLAVMKRTGVFEGLPAEAEDVFVAVYEEPCTVDEVAAEVGIPSFKVESVLDDLTDTNAVEYLASSNVYTA